MNRTVAANISLTLVTFFVTSLLTASAHAGVTQDSQARSVEAAAGANVSGATPPDDGETSNATGFGVYVDDALAGVVANNGLDIAQSNATALQESIIQKKSVEAFGETQVLALVQSTSGGGAFGDGFTELSYQFTLDVATNYEVLGLVSRFGPDSDATIELRRSDLTAVFAIGAPVGYVSTFVAQSGTLAADTYTLFAEADTLLSQLGPTGINPSTAGAEFEFAFALDVDAPGEIINGFFEAENPITGDIFGWTKTGAGTSQLQEIGNEVFVEFVTGSPAGLLQNVDTLSDAFLISFDYQFLDTSGTLELLLDGQSLLTLPAPSTLATGFQTASILVNSPSLLGQLNAPLEIIFDGPTSGLTAYVDNLSLSAIPEPASLVFTLIGTFAMLSIRNRRI